MVKYELYRNENGKVTKKSGTLPAPGFFGNVTEDFILNSMKGLLNSEEPVCPPRFNKNLCSNQFPPSNAGVDKKTKEYKILIAATDVAEDEYQVDLDDDKIIVEFDRKTKETDWLFAYKGLKFVTNERLVFPFDQRVHDASTAKVTLNRGALLITLQPREEVKPIRKTLAGGIKKTETEEVENTSEPDNQ